ncbi:hypothetical protein GCM10007939_22480 [Amylibacter marinus]|uniref:Membrane protein involved in the export of O-antigen and teichoic acid n=1 Tax=Amylibacter marinus TaxID=1475483 RepID=A0ABQ5VXE7_9RHOB|nr:hypothetical protein [Amylibacter marinus]GLQ35964.1 hypothetical protein GCM10007939_22480 [Amylibacter marinus]
MIQKGSAHLIHQFATSGGLIATGVMLNLFLQIVITRSLGIETLGEFTLWRNNILLVSGGANFGMALLILKEVPKLRAEGNAGEQRKFLFFVISVLLVGLCLVSMLYWLFSPLPSASNIIFYLSCAGFSVVVLGASYIRASGDLVLALVLDNISVRMLLLGFLLIGLVMGGRLNVQILYFAAILVTASILSVAVWQKFRQNIRRVGHGAGVGYRYWSQETAGFFLLSVAYLLGERSTLFISGLFLPAFDLGQFAFMSMLAGLLMVPQMAVNRVIAPQMANKYLQKDFVGLREIVRIARWFLFAIGVCGAGVLYLAYPLAESATNAKGAIIPSVFFIMLLSGVVLCIGAPVGIGISMIGRQRAAAIVFGSAVIIKILAFYMLVPRYGIVALVLVELGYVILWNLIMAGRFYYFLQLEEQADKPVV